MENDKPEPKKEELNWVPLVFFGLIFFYLFGLIGAIVYLGGIALLRWWMDRKEINRGG